MEKGRDIRFAADPSLGRLCKWLRILGFDALYESGCSGADFQTIQGEGRVLLTRIHQYREQFRDHRLIFIRHNHFRNQLDQVIEAAPISRTDIRPFSRCVRCNLPLRSVEKSDDLHRRVPDYIWRTRERFEECTRCDRVFWRGTHRDRIAEEVDRWFPNQSESQRA